MGCRHNVPHLHTNTHVFTKSRFLSSRLSSSPGCGGPIKAPSGEIHSPNYPANYPNMVDCSWTISVDVGHRVLFNFTDLDIELHSTCQWDHVAVSDYFLNDDVCGVL